jgi:hypothetical protein
MKEGNIILKIRRVEVDFLRKNGFEWAVKHSYSKNPTYYVVTEEHVLRALEKFRDSIRIK